MNAAARLAILAALVLAGCRQRSPDACPGYVEGEFVHVASPLGGTLASLAVERGTEVRAGQVLFVLDAVGEAASLRETLGRAAQAQARRQNLVKGRRPTELAALTAQVQRAEANLQLSRLDRERQERLGRDNVLSAADLDLARARQEADAATVAALSAELATARLGAREDELAAASADIEACEAACARARWAVEQKRQCAPTNAWVEDTLFRPGEWVPGGSPVVTLLPPANVKIRFFVPEPQLAAVGPGRKVAVAGDGLARFEATVSYVAARAEFTPPVLYSRESRAKLVFLVEARPDPAAGLRLRPGQPVEVRIGTPGP
jgi:HlyD family secretion protein